MPISEEATPVISYRQKYRNLKRKLKFLLYENECFQEELRKAQRKLLKVSRDKNFLLDQILQYESIDSSSSDSDATVSSDSEPEQRIEPPPVKKKKPPPPPQPAVMPAVTEANVVTTVENLFPSTSAAKPINSSADPSGAKKKKPPRKPPAVKPAPPVTTIATLTSAVLQNSVLQTNTLQTPSTLPNSTLPSSSLQSTSLQNSALQTSSLQKKFSEITETLSLRPDGHMTSEEVERHLEARQALRDLLPEKTPLTVPAELFSNEPMVLGEDILEAHTRNSSPSVVTDGMPEDQGLIIDLHE